VGQGKNTQREALLRAMVSLSKCIAKCWNKLCTTFWSNHFLPEIFLLQLMITRKWPGQSCAQHCLFRSYFELHTHTVCLPSWNTEIPTSSPAFHSLNTMEWPEVEIKPHITKKEKHNKIIQTMMEYRHCVCVLPSA